MQQFKIRNNRLGHVIVLLAVILLMSITFWAFFFKDDPVEITGVSLFIMIIIGGIGSVVLFTSVRAIMLNPDILVINEKGFEYNPGGISSGFIEWTNVAEIKFIEVITNNYRIAGLERVLAIKFKDPTLYNNQFNPAIRILINLNKKIYDADMFFRLSSFGKQAEEVNELMMNCWNENNNVSIR